MYLSKQLRNIIFAYVKHNPDIFKDFGQTIYLHTMPDEMFHREVVCFLGIHKQDGIIPLSIPDHQKPRTDYLIERFNEHGIIVTDEDSKNILTLPECCGLMARDKELSAVIALVRIQHGMEHNYPTEDSIEVKIACYADVGIPRDWNPGDEIPVNADGFESDAEEAFSDVK